MAFSHVASQDKSATGTGTCTVVPAATPTAGDLLVMSVETTVGTGGSSIPGWTLQIDQPLAGGGASFSMWYKVSVGTESSITVTGSGGTQAVFAEFSGALNATPVETSNAATSGNTSVASQATGTISTSHAGDVVIVGGASNAGMSSPVFATATLFTSLQGRCVAGFYLPGTTLSGFQDTLSGISNKVACGIVAFQAPVATRGSFLPFFH